jgi:hypothetical protein
MYADNQNKFVVVLNRQIDIAKLMNALGHMAAGLTRLLGADDQRDFLEYVDADCSKHPAISRYPFIVLSAKNGNHIRTLRQSAIAQGLPYNDFVDTMLGYSAEHQLDQTRQTKECDLEYFGIVLYGKAETLSGLTKKFSLFKSGSNELTEAAISLPQKSVQ